MIPREAVDNLIMETEQEHRIAHACLKPVDLYSLWTPEEVKAKKLKDEYLVPVPKKFGLDDGGKKIIKAEGKVAVFYLMEAEGISPIMYGYFFMGFSDGKTPKKS